MTPCCQYASHYCSSFADGVFQQYEMKCSVSAWFRKQVLEWKLHNKEADFISYNTYNKYYLAFRSNVFTPADRTRCCPTCKFKPKRVVMDGVLSRVLIF